ncbi:MAG: hypothetical protein O2840_00205 [bacterium]|nr:hypothetical protein [bacterium]
MIPNSERPIGYGCGAAPEVLSHADCAVLCLLKSVGKFGSFSIILPGELEPRSVSGTITLPPQTWVSWQNCSVEQAKLSLAAPRQTHERVPISTVAGQPVLFTRDGSESVQVVLVNEEYFHAPYSSIELVTLVQEILLYEH